MTTFKSIADTHVRITQLEQANAALHEEADTWWEALARAVRKNDGLQAEVDRLKALKRVTAVPAQTPQAWNKENTMTTELEHLKALAKAATKRGALRSKVVDCHNYATPELILALFAENERLTQANIDLTTTLRTAARRKAEPDSGMEILKL